MKIRIKRVYEKPGKTDGRRILIDRLWPRGLKKATAKIDLWLKEIAPSTELRRWFGHDPEKWPEFQKRYRREMKKNKEGLAKLQDQHLKGPLTLVYAAKDQRHNHAVVLKEYLEK